jgi:hypothetical protein
MRHLILTLLLLLSTTFVARAGGGDFPPQQSLPRSEIVIVPGNNVNKGNIEIWVALIGAVAAISGTVITVRSGRKHK